ncbi:MAG: hypothetical protein M0T80_06390, partial [Actinomycetota bacterium]|nr:hypothetical protein [Actinomycetota bacterium]
MASRPEKAAGLRPWGQLRAGHPGREQHPDSRLLEEAATALAWWADQRPPRPTSTLSGGGAVAAVEELLSDQLGGRAVLA